MDTVGLWVGPGDERDPLKTPIVIVLIKTFDLIPNMSTFDDPK